MNKLWLLVAIAAGEPHFITATQLYEAYKKNPIAAKAKYDDKPILLTGTIAERLASGTAIYLKIPDKEGLTAALRNDEIEKASKYDIGRNIKLDCIGGGLVFNIPMVIQCKVVE